MLSFCGVSTAELVSPSPSSPLLLFPQIKHSFGMGEFTVDALEQKDRICASVRIISIIQIESSIHFTPSNAFYQLEFSYIQMICRHLTVSRERADSIVDPDNNRSLLEIDHINR